MNAIRIAIVVVGIALTLIGVQRVTTSSGTKEPEVISLSDLASG